MNSNLSDHINIIEQSVFNDEYSTDEELIQNLKDNGVPDDVAEQGPALRDQARVDPFARVVEADGQLIIISRPPIIEVKPK